MKAAVILMRIRHRKTLGTAGLIITPSGRDFPAIEQPWNGNAIGKSCIPAGRYTVRRDTTGRFQWYEIENVPGGRTEIEIHPANHASELRGCVALGLSRSRNGYSVNSSRKAMQAFREEMGDADFELVVQWFVRLEGIEQRSTE